MEGDDEYAHYYQFEELVRGKKLTKADNQEGFAWGPEVVEVDENEVHPVIDDPKMANLDSTADADALEKMRECNVIYTDMLKHLDAAFTAGDSAELGDAIDKMRDLDGSARDLVEMPLSTGGTAGPSFEWLEAN